MKPVILFTLLIFILLTACKNNERKKNPPAPIPKALEEKGSYSLVTKRGGDNVLDGLYNELVEKTPELKTLENQIDNLNRSRNDSTEIFNTYNGMNALYYSYANHTMGLIKDSSIKEKIKELIANSHTKYDDKISEHTKLINAIDTKFLTLGDLHTFLKIKITLPIMEKYQKDNLPNIKPIETYEKQVDGALRLIDTLCKK
jgi:hypothetical protein